MKENKCFNCDESDHLSRDCSKLRKSKVAEMNVKQTKNSKKKVIFVEDATKINELTISSFFMKDDLFDESSLLIDCLVKSSHR